MITTPNYANIRKWHNALLSEQYPQTTGVLRREQDEGDLRAGYCCLGVAVECAILDGIPLEFFEGEYRWQRDVEHLDPEDEDLIWDTELPNVVQSWLGIHDDNPDLAYDAESNRTRAAIQLNDDDRWSFAMIAAAIKRTWPQAFEEH